MPGDAQRPTQTAAEPWMRGTHAELDPVRRAVVHALELAAEDAERWATPLTTVELHARPSGLPSVAFHMRHIVRSLDRLLTYAEDSAMQGGLDERQQAALETEHELGTSAADLIAEYRSGLTKAQARVRAFAAKSYTEQRGIGRKRLPTTTGGLLIHCAEHTQRHAGQMVTTARLLLATRTAVEDTKADTLTAANPR